MEERHTFRLLRYDENSPDANSTTNFVGCVGTYDFCEGFGIVSNVYVEMGF